MMAVTLEPVTADNRFEAEALEVAEDQRRFLDTTSISEFLADAPSYAAFQPHLIRADGLPVGLVSFGYLPEERLKFWVPLLIIDRRNQGQGYGRAAMQIVIDETQRTEPECRGIGLSYKPANLVAKRLYASLGFVPADEKKGEVRAWLSFEAG